MAFLQQLCQRVGEAEIAPRRISSGSVGDRPQNAPDLFLELGRRDGHQPGAYGVGRAPQQVAEKFDRKVDAKPEEFGEFIVGAGVGDDTGIAGIGKARARIVRQLSNHLGFAALDDHVGDGLRQACPARDREQMILPLCAGDLDEIAGPQAAGMGQHAAGHFNLVIPREMLDDLEWRVIDRRQPGREFRPCPGFDAADQKAQHVVKNLDLLLGETIALIQEKTGHLAKRLDPPLRRAASDGVLEFLDDRS